ncbi:Protein kinase-like domain protein [Tolypocladium paradoxum]|uniref:Protein kinase-like domain protein n=1 Tax=Tolypocladium paradoxum TaxID=94208 RepID=A0A2S4KUM7_9HYPO|nr:Protein kinase-like domain protein [Tolypocladium paradoxum]
MDQPRGPPRPPQSAEPKRAVIQCRFHIRSHSLSATGTETSLVHNHVYRLSIRRGAFDRCMHWLVSWLPRAVQGLKALPPAWCLPPKIVLKKLKPDWDDEFANESRMYARMKPLQGSVIPIYYGEARCDDGTPALILSDVGGIPLFEDEVFAMEEKRLEGMVEEAFSAMVSFGVQYDDLKLDNLHLVGDRIVILDLENAEALNSPAERAIELEVGEIMDLWKYYRRNRERNRE